MSEEERRILEEIISFETGITLENIRYLKENISKEYHKFLGLDDISNFNIKLKSNKASIITNDDNKIKIRDKYYSWEDFFNVFCISEKRKK